MICMLVIVAVLGVAFLINRSEGDETTQLAKTAVKVMKVSHLVSEKKHRSSQLIRNV